MRSDSTPSIPYGYCHCGCGRKTNVSPCTNAKRGYVRGEPMRFLFGHGSRITEALYVEQDCGYTTPCFVWQPYKDPNGYGEYHLDGKKVGAHRWMYEQRFGPIPEGLVIDHLCRNPSCVNPDHLEPVTQQVNTIRGIGPAAMNAQKTHCVHGHEFTVENTYTWNGMRECRCCRKLAQRAYRARQR